MRRQSPAFEKRSAVWFAKLDLRFDCSHPNALDVCATEEDAEWLRRVRANLPATMGSRDIIFQEKMEKSLKRRETEAEREAKVKAKWEDEKKVTKIRWK